MLHGIAKEGTNFINIDKRDKVETHALEQLSRIYRSLWCYNCHISFASSCTRNQYSVFSLVKAISL